MTNVDKIEMMFRLMEYDNLTDRQHDLIISYNDYYQRFGILTERQYLVLSDIFQQAAEK